MSNKREHTFVRFSFRLGTWNLFGIMKAKKKNKMRTVADQTRKKSESPRYFCAALPCCLLLQLSTASCCSVDPRRQEEVTMCTMKHLKNPEQ